MGFLYGSDDGCFPRDRTAAKGENGRHYLESQLREIARGRSSPLHRVAGLADLVVVVCGNRFGNLWLFPLVPDSTSMVRRGHKKAQKSEIVLATDEHR